ncbi:ABC transporter ATP-binding protein [Bradyrhizobium sp. STM 3557]|uniref:ABC transporter ATP-binding protein n=1 Tax=Bradyrhizobium sp. STM 3557 TaxID=578920 RepID=UPI00388DD576
MARISCSHVCKSYGPLEVVKDFNLEVDDHEFVVFLGPSGCGKSTILRMVAGLEDISDGTISIDGKVVNDLLPRERGVAMVFQNYALYPHMSVFANIAFGLKRMRVPREEIERRVHEVSAILGLESLLDRKPAQLSGGQQQRVAIARAMIKTPAVFLFDEPLSNLDAKLRSHMRVEIARLHKRLKTTTIYVTHDQLEAMTLADRIVVLRAGLIEQVGTPAEIYGFPKSRFVAEFVGSPRMNLLDVTVGEAPDNKWVLSTGHETFLVDRSRFDLHRGMRAVLGIRPANLKSTSPDIRFNGATGTVDLVEYLGDGVLLTVALPGEPARQISALVPAEAAPALGTVVGLSAPPEAIHVFDAETGLSCRSVCPIAVEAGQNIRDAS